MAIEARKPLAAAPMESREPKSIRFTPTEWEQIGFEARMRGLEPAVFVRMLTIFALEDVTRSTRVEASLGVPGIPRQVPGGSQRTRRF